MLQRLFRKLGFMRSSEEKENSSENPPKNLKTGIARQGPGSYQAGRFESMIGPGGKIGKDVRKGLAAGVVVGDGAVPSRTLGQQGSSASILREADTESSEIFPRENKTAGAGRVSREI
jgi:hypothetical protein